MRYHIVCTTNNVLNEGMNNIEKHFADYLGKSNIVTVSPLKDLASLVRNGKRSDSVFIFARGRAKIILVIWIAGMVCKNVFFVVVQKPERRFEKVAQWVPLRANILYLVDEDVAGIRLNRKNKMRKIPIGIDEKKFHPVQNADCRALKKKYGLLSQKPLVVHVGHCSKGRGLEDFLAIDKSLYDVRLIDSGLFTDDELKRKLHDSGITVTTGYIENINEVYQMADVYFFPTKSTDYVISLPLSVMEALSCGIPVIAYKENRKLAEIKIGDGYAIKYIEKKEEINKAIDELVGKKKAASLLLEPYSWDIASSKIMGIVEEWMNV